VGGRGQRGLPRPPADGGERSASPRSYPAGRGPARQRRALLSRPARNRMSHCGRKQLEILREPAGLGAGPGQRGCGQLPAPSSSDSWGGTRLGFGLVWHGRGRALPSPWLSGGCSGVLAQAQGGRGGGGVCVGGGSHHAPRLFDSQAITLFFFPPICSAQSRQVRRAGSLAPGQPGRQRQPQPALLPALLQPSPPKALTVHVSPGARGQHTA